MDTAGEMTLDEVMAAHQVYRRDLVAGVRRALLVGELAPVRDVLVAHGNSEALEILGLGEVPAWGSIHQAVCEMGELKDLHAASAAWLEEHGLRRMP